MTIRAGEPNPALTGLVVFDPLIFLLGSIVVSQIRVRTLYAALTLYRGEIQDKSVNAPSNRPAWFLLTRHWLSLVGTALVTAAGISRLFLLPLHMRGHVDNPYIGIIVFLILPVIFFTGLALIPPGIYFSKGNIQKRLREPDFDRKAAIQQRFGSSNSNWRMRLYFATSHEWSSQRAAGNLSVTFEEGTSGRLIA